MKLINLTPHSINLYKGDECVLIVPSVGVMRAEERIVNEIPLTICDDVETKLVRKSYGVPYIEETGQVFEEKTILGDFIRTLIGEENNSKIVVSYITLAAIQHHFPIWDYFFITTNEPVRNSEGQIIGCRSFAW